MTSIIDPDEGALAGYTVVDDRGRVTLPKSVRAALGLVPGSSISYVVVKGRLVIYPQGQELLRLAEDAAVVVEVAGLTTQDLLDELPAVRERVMRETYGDAVVDELARRQAEARAANGD
jgi:AbrB family looped-hinge helix DNA binding protein